MNPNSVKFWAEHMETPRSMYRTKASTHRDAECTWCRRCYQETRPRGDWRGELTKRSRRRSWDKWSKQHDRLYSNWASMILISYEVVQCYCSALWNIVHQIQGALKDSRRNSTFPDLTWGSGCLSSWMSQAATMLAPDPRNMWPWPWRFSICRRGIQDTCKWSLWAANVMSDGG